MTTTLGANIDSVSELSQRMSLSSEIAPDDYELYPANLMRNLMKQYMASFMHGLQMEQPRILVSYSRPTTGSTDETPVEPSLTTAYSRRDSPLVGSQFAAGWLESLTGIKAYNVDVRLGISDGRLGSAHAGYARRIKELCDYAKDDGIQVNPASVRDFWFFVGSAQFANKASLVLMDNGNLRAVWKGDNESHVGIQFLGEQKAEYVIFKRRTASADVSRVAGIDTLSGVKRQISAFGLTSLVNV